MIRKLVAIWVVCGLSLSVFGQSHFESPVRKFKRLARPSRDYTKIETPKRTIPTLPSLSESISETLISDSPSVSQVSFQSHPADKPQKPVLKGDVIRPIKEVPKTQEKKEPYWNKDLKAWVTKFYDERGECRQELRFDDGRYIVWTRSKRYEGYYYSNSMRDYEIWKHPNSGHVIKRMRKVVQKPRTTPPKVIRPVHTPQVHPSTYSTPNPDCFTQCVPETYVGPTYYPLGGPSPFYYGPYCPPPRTPLLDFGRTLLGGPSPFYR